MKEGRFERIAEDAFFSIDLASFQNMIVPYDALVANSTISMSGGHFEEDECPPASVTEEDFLD